MEVNKIEVQMSVPSIEKTIEWYERVMGWKHHFDVFDEDGKCGYGSVSSWENHFFNLSRVRSGEVTENPAPFVTFYIHVKDVDAVYNKVDDSGWETGDPPKTQIWGGRTFTIKDVNGFYLMFLQMVEEPTLKEIQERMRRSALSSCP